MRKRFLPVYYLKMAVELRKGTSRQQIIRELSQKHGVLKRTARKHLNEAFPSGKIQTAGDIERLLWERRRQIRTSLWDKRKAHVKGAKKLSPEQWSEIIRKGQTHRTFEKKSAASRKSWELLTPEEKAKRLEPLREGGRRISPEKRREAVIKGRDNTSPEARERIREAARRTAQRKTTKERSEAAKKGWANLSPEKQKNISEAARQTVHRQNTPEHREMLSMKAKARWNSLTPEEQDEMKQQLARMRQAYADLPPEKRSETTRKGAETKRKKTFGGLEYVESLPELNLLTQAEIDEIFDSHKNLIDEAISRYKATRRDFDEIQDIANYAFAMALAKWDKKMDLKKLIRDSIECGLIKYFTQERTRQVEEVSFNEDFHH